MPFIAMRDLRELLATKLGITDVVDQSILTDLAATKQEGMRLTMKQLVLLQPYSPTTVRRRIARLIQDGHVCKTVDDQDGRTDLLSPSAAFCESLWGLVDEIQAIHGALQQRLKYRNTLLAFKNRNTHG